MKRTMVVLFASSFSLLAQQIHTIRIDDYRPIAKALDEINRIGPVTVHYEDVRFEHPQDIEDATERVRNPLNKSPASAHRTLVPRPRAVAANFEVDSSGRLADSAAAERAVQALVAANDVADPPGKFRVERYGASDLFVVPETVRGADGSYRESASVLLTPISLSLKNVSGGEAIEAVLSAASKASGQKLWVATVPMNTLMLSRVSLDAADQPAGAALADLLRQMGGNLAIRLFYGPGVESYALNLHSAASPGATPPSNPEPPTPESSGSNPFIRDRTR